MDPDLAFMLQDAPGSVPVACGASQSFGILREATKTFEHRLGALDVTGLDRALIYDPATLPEIRKDASLTAGGRTFRVRKVQVREDGTALALLVNQ